ncbi:MAG: sporulation integral membrane protein YlbJ [Kyrpidia tusciae]|nr:sporulation integral membrane protein YlbJ [Kyrpidia tusciae]MBE3553192.1 sporulation integral membrane protein YlbJ [Kyrpidia tusciae]
MGEWSPNRTLTIILAIVVIALTLALVVYPEQGFNAGVHGMKIFWDVVFPSLLPFFILSEVMLGLGVVHALGVLLEPLMRPLFSVPGVGAFALSMGLAAGYPMDAVITAKFRKSGMCSRVEGERLLAFTNTADPLFMFGAVAVGMFHKPAVGVLIALAHYLASFLVGVSFKFYGLREERLGPRQIEPAKGKLFRRAFQELMRARQEDGRTLGQLLGDAVNDSIRTLLMICGFIIFFSVLLEVMKLAQLTAIVALPIRGLLALLGIAPSLVGPALSGLFEIDIGTAQVAAAKAPLIDQLVMASAIIAWSGFSVHAQVASVVTGTDIRIGPYFAARGLHAGLAALFTAVFWQMGIGRTAAAESNPVFPAFLHTSGSARDTLRSSLESIALWVLLIAAAMALSLLIDLLRRIRVVLWTARTK